MRDDRRVADAAHCGDRGSNTCCCSNAAPSSSTALCCTRHARAEHSRYAERTSGARRPRRQTMSSGVRQRRRPERAAPPSVEVATMAAVLATASTSSSDGPAHPRRRSRSAGPRARAAPAQPAGKGDAGEAEFVPDAVAPAGNDGGATTGCDAQTSGARASDDWLDRWQAFVPWLVFILCAATRYYRIREPPGERRCACWACFAARCCQPPAREFGRTTHVIVQLRRSARVSRSRNDAPTTLALPLYPARCRVRRVPLRTVRDSRALRRQRTL